MRRHSLSCTDPCEPPFWTKPTAKPLAKSRARECSRAATRMPELPLTFAFARRRSMKRSETHRSFYDGGAARRVRQRSGADDLSKVIALDACELFGSARVRSVRSAQFLVHMWRNGGRACDAQRSVMSTPRDPVLGAEASVKADGTSSTLRGRGEVAFPCPLIHFLRSYSRAETTSFSGTGSHSGAGR